MTENFESSNGWKLETSFHYQEYGFSSDYSLPTGAFDSLHSTASGQSSSDLTRRESSETDPNTDKTDDDSIVFERGIPQSLLNSPPQEMKNYPLDRDNLQSLDDISEKRSTRKTINDKWNFSTLTLESVFENCSINERTQDTFIGKDHKLLDNFLRKAESCSIKVRLPVMTLESPSRDSFPSAKINNRIPDKFQKLTQNSISDELQSFDVHAYSFNHHSNFAHLSKSRILRFSNIPATVCGSAITKICRVK